VAIYARVLSHEHRSNLEPQIERLEDSCAGNGYKIVTAVKEVVSGVNDVRPKFLALLADLSITIIVVEQKHRSTRFGFAFMKRSSA
jgi:putative resolvase